MIDKKEIRNKANLKIYQVKNKKFQKNNKYKINANLNNIIQNKK